MPQAKGAATQLLLQREITYRTLPGVVAAFKMPFTTFNPGKDAQKVDDPSISASPLGGKKGDANPVFQPSLTSILDLRSIGHWLALLMGVPTSFKAVTKQPTNVTGVTVNYGAAACPSGNGTLTFTAAAHTLEWKAQGDATPGAAVDVSAGGYFTLQSGTAAHSVHVTVAAASLPVVDKSDTDIAVSATLKCHVFPVDLADRPSALLEPGYTDIGKYYPILGNKVNTLSYDVGNKDQNITVALIGAVDSEETVPFDAAPTAYNSVRACAGGGSLWNGVDSSLGTITEGKVEIGNNMSGELTIKTDNTPIATNTGYGLVNQGDVMLKGSIKTVFDSLGAYALARSNTSTRMRIASRANNGSDTFAMILDLPFVAFDEKSVPISGKSGVFADLDWAAHRDSSGRLPLVMLVNDIPSY
ncbi:MAG: hypothetical protein LLG15_11215 [Betaproteobacteria bacterium]|nr:hypothetical protein [Betaproteobacteria bacterium]